MKKKTKKSIDRNTTPENKCIVSLTEKKKKKMKMTFNMQKYYAGIGESVSEVKDQAFEQLKVNAEKLNANAVVGIQVDIELTTSNYVAISVTGTAVSVIKR